MSYVKVRRVPEQVSTYSAVECEACEYEATCPAIAIAAERDKLARRVQRLQTALDRLTAAILPDGPPC